MRNPLVIPFPRKREHSPFRLRQFHSAHPAPTGADRWETSRRCWDPSHSDLQGTDEVLNQDNRARVRVVRMLGWGSEGRGFESERGDLLHRRAKTPKPKRSVPSARTPILPRSVPTGTPHNGRTPTRGHLALGRLARETTSQSQDAKTRTAEGTPATAAPRTATPPLELGPLPPRPLPWGLGPLRAVPTREHAGGDIAVACRACGDLAPGESAHREGSGPGDSAQWPDLPH